LLGFGGTVLASALWRDLTGEWLTVIDISIGILMGTDAKTLRLIAFNELVAIAVLLVPVLWRTRYQWLARMSPSVEVPEPELAQPTRRITLGLALTVISFVADILGIIGFYWTLTSPG
jgi:hypothetical protein